jgi:hypothetical protein
MKQGRQADVGFYLRIPVELDRRLHIAAAARHGGYVPRGALKRLVLEMLTGGLEERENPRYHARKLAQLERDRKGAPKRPKNGLARIAQRRRRK